MVEVYGLILKLHLPSSIEVYSMFYRQAKEFKWGCILKVARGGRAVMKVGDGEIQN